MTTRLPKSNDPTPIALDKLADQFLPVACHALQRDIERINGRLKDRGHPPIRLEGTVERDCESRYAIVCNLCISIAGPMGGPEPELSMDELDTLADAFLTFCTFNHKGIDIDGLRWNLGDGDDSGAVRFRKGAFCIWLRHFKGSMADV
jgi:hypothetical protein